MSSKQKLLIILGIPFFILAAWIYALFSVLNKDPSSAAADINNVQSVKTGIQTGVSGNNSVLAQDLSGSQEISGNQITGEATSNIKVQKITVYMPDFFYNKGFDILSKKLLKEKKLLVKFQTFKNMDEYKDYLNTNILSGSVDIYMIPSDRIDSFENNSFKFDFNKDISPLFNYMFYDYIKSKKYTYIPYSIDPFISLVSKSKNIGESTLSIDKLKEISLTSSAENSSRILFNISSFDLSLMKLKKTFFSDYFLIIYNFIYQAYLSQDPSILSFFLPDSSNQSVGEDSKKLLKLITLFSKKNEDCQNFVNVCLMSNGYGDMSFGFLSYLDIWNKYFPDGKKTTEDFDIANFISDSNIYLVRGWGFVVNKSTKNPENSLAFLNEYITQSVDGNRLFWDSSLSAFNNILSNQRIDKKYDKIFKYENKFQLLHGSADMQDSFLQKTNVLDVLKGNYSIGAFLDKLEWEF